MPVIERPPPVEMHRRLAEAYENAARRFMSQFAITSDPAQRERIRRIIDCERKNAKAQRTLAEVEADTLRRLRQAK